MSEIDLMARYPKTKRKDIIEERVQASEADREIARRFDKAYFDGPRRLGLGGYHYNPKFFTPVVEDMISHYGLTGNSSVLDVGCAKGFMLHDFKIALPDITVAGIDISDYCLQNAMPDVAQFLRHASCDLLPFPDKSFDLVISIATIHNLDLEGVKRSLREIMRVSRKHAFIKVNGYHTDAERDALHRWNLVAKTILHVDEWQAIFTETQYLGDYYWFTP
ncbi:MAG: class I SAM-dependent methyltransferase [Telmatospirillum sp.]|nr:class I SAM-dependent methyltransferase [Telmatospirillum sp.]